MKIAHLTAGTGHFHCGNCHRDNTLVKALHVLGHEAYLVPLYLPLVLDEDAAPVRSSLFVGGLNLYLQQKLSLFRHTPRWLDRWLDHRALLKKLSTYLGLTEAHDLGEMTLSTFRARRGPQAKEWDRLLQWLATQKPDVVALSNALLSGLARDLKEQLGCRVVCSLQGEDYFVDSLPAPYRDRVWQAMRDASPWVDAYVSVSDYYEKLMTSRLQLPAGKNHVVPNGINLDHYTSATNAPTTKRLGYLARLSPLKGLDSLIDTFITLKKDPAHRGLQLAIAGACSPVDEPFITAQKEKIIQAGLHPEVEWHPNLPPEKKVPFLQSLSALCVPALYGEAFGLYVIEAWACGVPVIGPRTAAFPELFARYDFGLMYDPERDQALLQAVDRVLRHPPHPPDHSLLHYFSAPEMARRFYSICAALT